MVKTNKQRAISKLKRGSFDRLGKTNLDEVNYPPLATLEDEQIIKEFYQSHPELNVDKDAWIQTYTGKAFYPQNPTPESIDIIDIAHALSQQCRFTGHTSSFYSTAQHSVLVSYLCNEENKLYGLIHDGSEAFTGDLAAPTKRISEMTGFRQIEKKIQQAICKKFGLPIEEPKDVKRADLMMLSIESNSFMMPQHKDWKLPINIPSLRIDPLSPKDAEELFLKRFDELYPKSGI
jgi:5'-nucleotidase